ncbi:MAG: STAS domain-containing protein [Ignavibacteria bacterium]|jgi:ABC-type transporter Mla MlaB component
MAKQNSRKKLLELNGDLSIQNIKETKKLIEHSLENNASIIIDHSNVVEIDLSYVQLLIAMQKQAIKNKKKIEIKDGSKLFLEILQLSGIDKNNFSLIRS